MTGVTGLALASHACIALIGKPGLSGPAEWRGFRDFLALALDSGYDGVDLSSGVFPLGASDSWWRSVAGVVDEHGLRVASVNSLRTSLCDPDFGELGLSRALRAIEVAALIGSDTMNIAVGVPHERLDANEYIGAEHPPGGSRGATEADFDLTARRLDIVGDRARSVGVELVLELHYCSIADSTSSVEALLGRLREPVLVNPDLVNGVLSYPDPDDSWEESLLRLAPHSGGVWHVKNLEPSSLGGRPVDARLSDGVVDYPRAVQILRDASYSGWISVESCGAPDFESISREGAAFLRTVVDERTER